VTVYLVLQVGSMIQRLEVASASHDAPAKVETSHGADTVRKPASPVAPVLISLDEVLVNIQGESTEKLHSLGVRLELELFSDQGRNIIEQRQAGIKHTVIESSQNQDYRKLSTLSGKLYFKELLVSRINSFLNQPVVRDIHFSAFFLQ